MIVAVHSLMAATIQRAVVVDDWIIIIVVQQCGFLLSFWYSISEEDYPEFNESPYYLDSRLLYFG